MQQSYYSNPHQMQAAAVAAAAAASGVPQRFQYPGPLPTQNPVGNDRPSILHTIPGSTSVNTPVINNIQSQAAGMTDDTNDSEMESDLASENDEDDINDIDSEKLDASHKEILEKLKRQEQEERAEIEEELKEAELARRHQHQTDDDEQPDCDKSERSSTPKTGPDTPEQTEIKMQRPLGLLAQHGLSVKNSLTKTHSAHSLMISSDKDMELMEREYEHEEEMKREMIHEREHAMTGLDFSSHLSLLDRRFMPSPPPDTPPGCHDPNKSSSTPVGHHWTFEEQFKQLYEMSHEPKRKEFLDDLFAFMQKRGTPVNRIPIMAKQTLDLYELFRLVVSKGGLVEVINKKLWREITKGLNLPSSITSAAFTLRTQYMKYLYPYECEKLKLSTLGELQSAIDGNRREGRRPGYGYDFSPLPTMLPTPPGPHLNGGLRPMAVTRPSSGLSPKDDERTMMTSHSHMRSLAEHDARAIEAATRAMEEVSKRMEEASRAATNAMTASGLNAMTASALNVSQANKYNDSPPCKRPMIFEDERLLAHMHSTHLKLTSRSNGRLEYDSSMVVSMEINGLMYQGVLFAQHPRRI